MSTDMLRQSKLCYGVRATHGDSPLSSALVALKPASQNEATGNLLMDISMPELGDSLSVNTKTCTSWAILFASYGCRVELGVVATDTKEFTKTFDILLRWDSSIEDLYSQVGAQLENLSLYKAESLPSDSASASSMVETSSSSGASSPKLAGTSSSDDGSTSSPAQGRIEDLASTVPLKSRGPEVALLENKLGNLSPFNRMNNKEKAEGYGHSIKSADIEDIQSPQADAFRNKTFAFEMTIECLAEDARIQASTIRLDDPMDQALLPHMFKQYEYILRQLSSLESLERPLADLKAISPKDLKQIWNWNAQPPKAVNDTCVHEIIMERARRHPDIAAIDAHDGQLTYRELDDLSTRLAGALILKGVKPGSTVIVFIENSMCVPVAQLAIMKSGCISTVLDVTLPSQRHELIAELVQPAAILSSSECAAKATSLQRDYTHLVLDDCSSRDWPKTDVSYLPKVHPPDWLYIVFTSGSTGVPKGAIISHKNYVNAVVHQQQALDVREYDRVFDFASYSFDAAWCNMIHALTVGGCLCIPSDQERKQDVAEALRKYHVNYAVLTPSVAWFPASELPDSLRTIHFGGEPLKAAMVQELSTRVTVINAYGPAECSTVSTAIVANPNDDRDPSIGTGLGACTWVVKLDGTDLVPIGEIGELWVEGPIVGQGYLGDAEKTAAAFVESPSWLLRGCDGIEGRRERDRLYRTGDLVRYNTNGTLEFVGRKDSQVKVRGQRVELGEIDYNLERALTEEARAENVQIIAEVIKPQGSNVPTLVSFLFRLGISTPETKVILEQTLVGIQDRLAELVPPYMVPSAFLPLETVPMTPTGKVDRRRLREDGPKMYWQQLNAQRTSLEEESEPKSETEEVLQKVWSRVLNLPLNTIGLDAAFTRLGGDSISAMQIVSRCREQNMAIKVADILKFQSIRRVACTVKPIQERANLEIEAADEGKSWPLSPIQQIFFDNNPEGMNHYTLSFIVKLTRRTTYNELLAALATITDRHSMLRARFRRQQDGPSWEQYVATSGSESFLVKEHDFIDGSTMQMVVDDRQASLDLVDGPVFAVDLFNSVDAPQTMLTSAHHVIMDLVSWRVIWHELSQLLTGGKELPPVAMSFQTWSLLQRKEAANLDPDTVLPFQITPADFKYWEVSPRDLLFKDSSLDISTVGPEATELLLGASNECFRTEIMDILVGTLISCFSQSFPDRSPPAIFLEGHGREPVAGIDDADLSDIVGWFTSLHPIQLSGSSDSSVFDMIRLAKDVRRQVPGKGRPYFASRVYSKAGEKAFRSHRYPEIIFNYRGSFQQLEDAQSIIKYEDRESRDLLVPGDGADYQRPSLIDLNLVVQDKKLQIWTRFHKKMRNSHSVAHWIRNYAESLSIVAYELAKMSARPTMADFPLLEISYPGLETLVAGQLESQGIEMTEIQDIYPCTPMQEGILISSALGTASYHTVSVWKAVLGSRQVSVPRLEAAWKKVARLHPALSTVFSTNPDTGRYIQVVLSATNEAGTCNALTSETAVEHLKHMQGPVAKFPQPECFFTICADENGDVACRLDISHTLMDAASLTVITRDLENAYAGLSLNSCPPFRDYVDYIQRTPGSRRLMYWKEYLRDIEICDMPGDVARDLSASPRGTSYDWINLPRYVTAPIAERCREMGLTRSAYLHIAWSLVLGYFTGMHQVCFGYLSSGRDSPVDGIEDIVGPIISMLVARVDLDQPLTQIIGKINHDNIGHLENKHVSLAELQHEVSKKRLFNTNITVREARVNPEPVDGRMQLVEVMEYDPHEVRTVCIAQLSSM